MREVEKIIGKQFVDGTLPSPQEICSKQLFKAIDEIEKVDVDEDQIAPFMEDINRHFEFYDKEDILKKIVSLEFGEFFLVFHNAVNQTVINCLLCRHEVVASVSLLIVSMS